MKGNHWFILAVIAFLLLIFVVEYRIPKKFVWHPTFSRYDRQPFGCALFDEVLSSSLPEGYTLSGKTFYQLEQEDTASRYGVLVLADNYHFSEVDIKSMLQSAERGNKILLAGHSFNQLLKDTLKFDISYSSFSPTVLKKYASSFLSRDTLCWTGDSATYLPQEFYFYPQLCGSHFLSDSLSCHVLARKKEGTNKSYPVALSVPWGKGKIILVSTPLLFTNYGIVDGENANYLFRLLSQMGDLPLVRTEGYMQETAKAQISPFRYFLSQRPLRWALYLTVIASLLFLFFTARRKQRAIPVISEPQNGSLEFAELIGTLYYQQNNHIDLVRKKYTYFAEELRREIQVDIEDREEDSRSFSRMARKTGLDEEQIGRFVREVRAAVYDSSRVTAEQMKGYIDKMNEIINQI